MDSRGQVVEDQTNKRPVRAGHLPGVGLGKPAGAEHREAQEPAPAALQAAGKTDKVERPGRARAAVGGEASAGGGGGRERAEQAAPASRVTTRRSNLFNDPLASFGRGWSAA